MPFHTPFPCQRCWASFGISRVDFSFVWKPLAQIPSDLIHPMSPNTFYIPSALSPLTCSAPSPSTICTSPPHTFIGEHKPHVAPTPFRHHNCKPDHQNPIYLLPLSKINCENNISVTNLKLEWRLGEREKKQGKKVGDDGDDAQQHRYQQWWRYVGVTCLQRVQQ